MALHIRIQHVSVSVSASVNESDVAFQANILFRDVRLKERLVIYYHVRR
jgi:hypothetical protein